VLLDFPGLVLVIAVLAVGVSLALWFPTWLTTGERLLAGIVSAVVLIDFVAYGLALLVGVTAGLVWLLIGVSIMATVLLAGLGRRRSADLLRSPPAWTLLAAIAVMAIAMGWLFGHAIEITPNAWLAHYNNTWSDWAFHASDTTAFVYGKNLPPQNPVYAGTPLRYPFLPDFASAVLLAGGWNIPAALTWPSWAMAVLALSGLILWARRLTGRLAVGVIAVTLTLLGGGLGFAYMISDATRLGLGRAVAVAQLQQTYDKLNIQWYNPILSYYLPQRSFVFGAAILMTVLILLTPVLQATGVWRWRAELRSLWAQRTHPRLSSEAAAFIVAGMLCGGLPWFHVHSLLVLGLVTTVWALIFPRPAWIGFFAALFVLAVPRLLAAVPGDATAPIEHQYPRLIAGWLSAGDNPVWFWLKNTGLFWPILAVGLLTGLALKTRTRLILAPFLVVFVVANLVKFQPWEWDNSKLLVFWYLSGAIAVGAVLVRVTRLGVLGWMGASLAWLTLVAAGALSLGQALRNPAYDWFTSEQWQLAAEVRQMTPPHAVFLTGSEVTDPVADLAGRPVVMSYRGWLWSYGIDYRTREADVARIYAGDPQALSLLHRYNAQYVVISPGAYASWQVNLDYFTSNFTLVIRTQNYEVFLVPPA